MLSATLARNSPRWNCVVCQDEPVKDILRRWELGEDGAADEIHRRYAQRLSKLAEKEIGRRLQRRLDADDILQSVFRTFFRRTARGDFAIDHSGALWNLLVRITLAKIRGQAEDHQAGKRSMAAEESLDGESSPHEAAGLRAGPEEVVGLIDEIETVLARFKPPGPQIFYLHLQGHTNTEIATQTGCTRRLVSLTLERIKDQLHRRLEDRREN
jgi:RNA polymerase sigma-70 factor (ECF subfamily)